VNDEWMGNDPNLIRKIVGSYKSEGFKIVFKDFGHSMCSLELLYFSSPKVIKLDNSFLLDMHDSITKQHFLKSLTELCHSLHIYCAATNVENKSDFYLVKELGFDFVSGKLLQKDGSVDATSEVIKELLQKNKRTYLSCLDDSYIQTDILPLSKDSSLHDLFSYFYKNPKRSFVPIVDENDGLVGVIYEDDIKKITYSQYGLSLARNDSFAAKMSNFIKPVVWVEKSWKIDKAIELYSRHPDSNKGIFVTQNGRYYGFISVKNLLELSYNRNLEIAQEQNPLTKLPGNKMIEKYLMECNNDDEIYHLVYFDFNDFKPFNDSYGFRKGDRAILIFSDILKKRLAKYGFIAHVGGDDFLQDLKVMSLKKFLNLLIMCAKSFHSKPVHFINKKIETTVL